MASATAVLWQDFYRLGALASADEALWPFVCRCWPNDNPIFRAGAGARR
jgi:hypothetical protein